MNRISVKPLPQPLSLLRRGERGEVSFLSLSPSGRAGEGLL